MTRLPILWRAAAILAVALVSGCDLLDPGGRSYAGVVVDAETQEPIANIHVSLQTNSGFAAYSMEAEDLTDAEGRFWLRDPLGRASPAILFVNSPALYTVEGPNPYNPLYEGTAPFYDADRRHDIRVELRRLP